MNCKEIFYIIFILIYQFVIPGLYLFFSVERWDYIDICDRRVCICIFIIGFFGIHRCYFINRLLFKYKGLEMEITIIFSIIAFYNQRQQNCIQQQNDYFVDISNILFYITLWVNIIFAFLTLLLWIIAQVLSFIVLLQNNPTIHNQQETGLTDEEINQLSVINFKVSNEIEHNNLQNNNQNNYDLQIEQNNNNNQMEKSYDQNMEEIKQESENQQNNNIIQQQNNYEQQQFQQQINVIQKNNEKQGCSICLSDFEQGDQCLQLPCKHLYHKECVKQWLQKRIICPNCRNDIRESLMYQQFINNQNPHPIHFSDKFLDKINENLEPSLGSEEYPELSRENIFNNNIINN